MTYQAMIAEMADDINPAGVEAAMRLQYATLSHLPRETFAAEIDLARECERAAPGYLRRIAVSMGLGADFDKWGNDR